MKKTHDAAVAILQRFYGKPPERMFFLGGSTGGREAFFVMQLWPDDYDGVLGAYAGWDQTELDLQFIRVSQAMYAKGGFLPSSKTRLLARAVMQACDALDGVSDGIISNVAACHFDPATLLCPSGTDSKNCLTPQQLTTVQTFATEQKTDSPSGERSADHARVQRARRRGFDRVHGSPASCRTSSEGPPEFVLLRRRQTRFSASS